MSSARILLWFRTDLRLHDNEALFRAAQNGGSVLPVYCFDPRNYGQTLFGFPKTGAFRAQFINECVADLKANLRSFGGDLQIFVGKPEEILPKLVENWGAEAVYACQEAGTEEIAVEAALRNRLPETVEIKTFWGHTLYHPDDTPFRIAQMPEQFNKFKNLIEFHTLIRNPFPTPNTLNVDLNNLEGKKIIDDGIPDLSYWGLNLPLADERRSFVFIGGETAAKARLETFIWQNDGLRKYKDTRNELSGADFSGKISPYLAQGCLSPRFIFSEVQRYERQISRNESTYWFGLELIWRDFFRFLMAKTGARFFLPEGLVGAKIDWKDDRGLFNQWAESRTGFPILDAVLTELRLTGYLSIRGRMIAASFLTKNLGLDWRMGAEWFESHLIDYDPANNYGNWAFYSGVGADQLGFNFLHTVVQGEKYDPQGLYVRQWLPVLKNVAALRIHQPHLLSAAEQKLAEIEIGKDYPAPMVDLVVSAKEVEQMFHRCKVRGGVKRASSRIRRFIK